MAGQCQRDVYYYKSIDLPCGESITYETAGFHGFVEDQPPKHDYTTDIKRHGRKEHLAAAGAVLGGAVALFEKHQAKKDPVNAHKHRVGEAIAGAVAVGSGAYAVHERHDKKDAEKQAKYHLNDC